MVLLLVFVFSVSALLASGALDDGIDPSEASTRILTPEEIQQMAEDSNSASRSGEESAPVALIAALFLVAGTLLVSLAVPTRAERRRTAARVEPRRQMGTGVPEPPPLTIHAVNSAPVTAAGDDAHTLVLQPRLPAPAPAPAPACSSPSVFARPAVTLPVPTPPIERRYRAGAIMRPNPQSD